MAMAQPPDAVQARIAPYTGRTSLFLFGGISLILANLLLSQQGWSLVTALFPSLPAPASVNATNVSVMGLVGEVVLLGALLLVGSVDDEAGTFALVFLAALWLVFLIHHQALFSGLLSRTANESSGGGGTSSSNTNAWLH